MARFAVVTGAGGFIGAHVVRQLKGEGYRVRAVGHHEPRFEPSAADEYEALDLRDLEACRTALRPHAGAPPDEVYQFAASMGGMGFIHEAELEIMQDSSRINQNLVRAAADAGVGAYFLASSVCVYRDMQPGEPALTEDDAYPAQPANEYGWEKLFAERVVLAAARHGLFDARVARFENSYGPGTVWTGGREKAPAALCRKAAMAADGDSIEVWGSGSAVRNFTYIDDLVAGIRALMTSELRTPVNIGSDEYVTVSELADAVVAASGKQLTIDNVPGPVGVASRNFSHELIKSTGWRARVPVADGIPQLYEWVDRQVAESRAPAQT
jgi:nucleoside-diphosphate-sugar epimerase